MVRSFYRLGRSLGGARIHPIKTDEKRNDWGASAEIGTSLCFSKIQEVCYSWEE